MRNNDKKDPSSTSIYASFQLAQQQISGIEAIDYFFAKELVCLFDCNDHQSLFHLLMALSESLRNGHTCLPIKILAGQKFGFSSDDSNIVKHNGYIFPSFESLILLLDGINITEHHLHPIVFNQQKLYLRRYYQFENELRQFIVNRNKLVDAKNVVTNYSNNEIKDCISSLFPSTTSNNDVCSKEQEIDWQKIAVANAINKNFCIIAGGPGTGKTYTVTKLLAALVMLNQNTTHATVNTQHKNSNDFRIALVAPTGKAAQRLSESIINAIEGFRGKIDDYILNKIPSEALTIHRLLGVIPNSPNFRHHQDNLLALDLILIDEVSMVDLAMMTRIFRALPEHCKVVLLGDADQLPSVSAGSVLADLAPRPHNGYSKNNLSYLNEVTSANLTTKIKRMIPACDHVTFLIKSRRFDGSGGIGRLSQMVINGKQQQSWQLLNDSNIQTEITLFTGEIKSWLTPLVEQYYRPIFQCKDIKSAFMQLAKFRILCATKKGEQGVVNINEQIKAILMAKGDIAEYQLMYAAMPIIINENDYKLGLYNGDIGLLWQNDAGHLMAVFEISNNEYKWIMPSRLPQFETVYAMTIHKTQGSEFEHVAMILPNQKDNRLLSRELLYTGITRAKSQLSISANANVWRQGVETQVKRYSGLNLTNFSEQ